MKLENVSSIYYATLGRVPPSFLSSGCSG